MVARKPVFVAEKTTNATMLKANTFQYLSAYLSMRKYNILAV
jgi:hypothetical protein